MDSKFSDSTRYLSMRVSAFRLASLNADTRIERYRVESENFESIHNHSAYAMIEGPAQVEG